MKTKKKKAKGGARARVGAGVGLFLLKKFRRKGKKSPPVTTKAKSKPTLKPTPKVTFKRVKSRSTPSLRSPIRLSLQKMRLPQTREPKTRLKENLPTALPSLAPEVSAPIPLLSQVTPQVAPQLPEQVAEVKVIPAVTQESRFPLSTQDLIRPNDRLRQSIEAFLLDQRSLHTRKAYGKDLKRFVQYLHSRKLDLGIEAISRPVLIGYKDALLSEKLEHTTVDRHIATLRSFFKWLVDDGIIEKSPADGVRFLNPKRISSTLGFTDEEVKKVLASPDLHTRTGALHYAILMILFYCGLRRSEICELRTANLGVERNQRVVRLRGKGNAERIIVMVPPVWHAVKYYFHIARRDLTQDDFLFNPVRNNRTGVLKKSLDPSMIFYIVRKYARKAGVLNRVSPHSCRATAISNARDHHVPDRAIQEFAGWASPDMITRYDKRKNSVENSASRAISYGTEDRTLPSVELPLADLGADVDAGLDTGLYKDSNITLPQRE